MTWCREIYTDGLVPYFSLGSNNEVTNFVINRGIPERPNGCPNDIWALMSECFRFEPDNRPKFTQLLARLDSVSISDTWDNKQDVYPHLRRILPTYRHIVNFCCYINLSIQIQKIVKVLFQ